MNYSIEGKKFVMVGAGKGDDVQPPNRARLKGPGGREDLQGRYRDPGRKRRSRTSRTGLTGTVWRQRNKDDENERIQNKQDGIHGDSMETEG